LAAGPDPDLHSGVVYELQRKYEWAAQTPDVLVVMRALAPILHAAGKTQRKLKTDGYALSSKSTQIAKAKDLGDAARRVPDSMRSISLEYETPITFTSLKRMSSFRLVTERGYDYLKNTDSPVSVHLEMKGPDTDAIAGLMDRVKTQIDSELARQGAQGWRAEPAPMPVTAPSLGRRFMNHQWFVAIAGGLLVSLLVWAAAAGCHHLRSNDDHTPQVSTTTITPATTPSNAK
jgi:hypothetical protein